MEPSPETHTWSLRVITEAEGRAVVHARGLRFEVGPPVSFDARYPAVTALETALGALGADLVNGFRDHCHRRRIEVDRVEAAVEGRLGNPLVCLAVVGESGSPALERIEIKVFISSLAPPDTLRTAWEEALQRSPLARTLEALLSIDLRLTP